MKLDSYEPNIKEPEAREMVAVCDATYIGPGKWALVVRDPHKRENVYLNIVPFETTSAYQIARGKLEEEGFVIKAFVGDGRVAVPWLFTDIPTQMCHFHQIQIITRYTTQNPKLEAGRELLDLVKTLPDTDEDSFIDAFNFWCRKWDSFLKEKTINPKTGKWQYTHKKLRSARTSLRNHLPFLFTYLKYPELKMPNTANSLDGSFGKVKKSIAIHSGLKMKRKLKLIRTLIFGCD